VLRKKSTTEQLSYLSVKKLSFESYQEEIYGGWYLL
jgi:hypothetical protein